MKLALYVKVQDGISVLNAIQDIILSQLLCAYLVLKCALIVLINITVLLANLTEWDNYATAKWNMLLIILRELHGAVLAK